MKTIIFISSLFFLNFTSFGQVNRYTQPPPVSQYNPMTFEELKAGETNRRRAHEENMRNIEKIAEGLTQYFELRGTDEQLIGDLKPFMQKLEALSNSDLSSKRNELININESIKKAIEKYEKRLSTSGNESFFVDNSGLFKIKKGVIILSQPNNPSSGTGSTILGIAEDGSIKILKKENQSFYKVEFKGETGFLNVDFVKIN